VIRFRIKGLKHYVEKKTGKTYYYHRKSGTRITAPPNSAKFFEQMEAAEAGQTKRSDSKPGSFKLVMEHYRASHEFLGLQPETRKEYGRVMNQLSVIDTLVMAELNPPHIVEIRDRILKKRNRSFANKTLAIMSILFSYAIERGFANSNPVKLVKKIRRRSDAARKNRPWSKAELDEAISRAPPHIALPLMIGRWTGMREGDVLKLKKSDYDGQVIRCVTAKRQIAITIPVALPLANILNVQTPNDLDTICSTTRGTSWTNDGFKTSFFKFIRKLEL
jgi:integrase